MRNLTFLLLILLLTACRNDDLQTICFQAKSLSGEQVWIVNAYTPNGDGLNDLFRILPVYWKDSSGNLQTEVQSVTGLKVRKDGRTVYQSDTMYSRSGIQRSWNFRDQDGKVFYCQLDVQFQVNTDVGTYLYEYPICSYLCGQSGINTVNYSYLRFEDMLHPVSGFVMPSNDRPCN